MKVDQVRFGNLEIEDGVYDDGVSVVLTLSDTKLAELLAAYDPASGTSPSVADARPVLRAILDKILEA